MCKKKKKTPCVFFSTSIPFSKHESSSVFDSGPCWVLRGYTDGPEAALGKLPLQHDCDPNRVPARSPQLCHQKRDGCPGGHPWTSDLTCLSLSFLICPLGRESSSSLRGLLCRVHSVPCVQGAARGLCSPRTAVAAAAVRVTVGQRVLL